MSQKEQPLILIAEDDKVDQQKFLRFVKQQDFPFQYEICDSLDETLQSLEDKNYQTLVADYNLGDGTAQDILNHEVDIPIIITTGAGNERIAAEVMRAGAFDYLIKDQDYQYLTILPPVIQRAIKFFNIQETLKKSQSETKQLKAELAGLKRSEHVIQQKNKELEQAKEQAVRSEKTMEQFLANMSHEVRTPLHGIMGMVNLLSKTKINEKQSDYIKNIKQSTEILLVLINDILDTSALQTGKVKLQKNLFDLGKTLEVIEATYYPAAAAKQLDLIFEKEEKLPNVLKGDVVRLKQILNNLVSNAIKYTSQGKVKILARENYRSDKEVQVTFEVHDTGIGIPEEKTNAIFNSFVRIHKSSEFKGTGLGLAIVKQLVDLMKGEIKVKSHKNKGSIFTLTLPFEIGNEDELVADKQLYESTHDQHLKNLNVLLVEDNRLNRFIATEILQDWDCLVTEAENGKEALQKLRNKFFDVVLMDLEMPVMNGYDTTRFIREKLSSPKRQIPIIALTGHATKKELEKCEEVGMNDYLTKPFKAKKLYKVISKIVGT